MFIVNVTRLFGYCAIAAQQLDTNMIKHHTATCWRGAVPRDGRVGGRIRGEQGMRRVGGRVECLMLPGVCFHLKIQKQPPPVPQQAGRHPG